MPTIFVNIDIELNIADTITIYHKYFLYFSSVNNDNIGKLIYTENNAQKNQYTDSCLLAIIILKIFIIEKDCIFNLFVKYFQIIIMMLQMKKGITVFNTLFLKNVFVSYFFSIIH